MINTALSSPGPNSRFSVSSHNGARPRRLARARLRHLARREVSVQVRARRLREHEVVRGVVGAHPPVGPDHLRRVRPSARHALHAHAVFTRMSEHGPPNPQLLSTPITRPTVAATGGAGGELRGSASFCHC